MIRSVGLLLMLVSSLALLAGACDSASRGGKDGSIGGDPCKDDFDPACGEDCFSSVDCGDDLYCGDEGKCTADCSPGGDECGPDALCVAHGHCMETCAGVSVQLDLLVPTVLLLIDQSGSMTEDFGGRPRWQAVQDALAANGAGVVWDLQDQIRFGASLYTSNGGSAGGDCPILTTVLPKMVNAEDIQRLLHDNAPAGDTPTGESLEAAADLLRALPPDPEHPGGALLIVLATDGEPDTCAQPNPQNGQPESIAGAQYAWSHGVRTVVLSVGRDVSGPHLQDVANAGAGLPLDGSEDAPYYVADDPAQLAAAFDEIAQGVRGCVFALDGRVEPIEYAAYGQVALNGQELTYGDPDGWRLIDASTLELLGQACETFLNEEGVELSASFPCGAVATE